MTDKLKFNSETSPVQEKNENVSYAETVESFLKQADLSEKDFEPGEQHAWRLQASVYRQLIWELANIFVEGQTDLMTEMTHSEYIRDPETGDVKALDFCLEFSEELEDGTRSEYRSYEKFRQFLENHPQVIPEELRKRFNVYVGFNYGNQGGLLIKEKDIEMIDQAVLNAIKSEGRIGYADHVKENIFIGLLRDFLREKLLPKA